MRVQILAVLAGMTGLVSSFNQTLRDSFRGSLYNSSDIIGNISAREIRGIIPVSEVTCSGRKLDPDDFIEAREKMAQWGRHHILPGRCMKYLFVNEIIYFICNCKYWYSDRVPLEELMEVEALLYNKCGPWQSGIVFSKKWDKAYEIQPKSLWDDATKKEWPEQHVCPPYCVECHVHY
ncbi:hypothetical protein F4818DRAFT_144758 [Hypoxylon cercidicola]|nr:hypothetical protein F4818DRAFT_144758 [Hypoxylon cercidicola]